MEDRFAERPAWLPWAAVSVVLVLVAVIAYQFGAHEPEVARAGRWHWGFPWGLLLFFWLFAPLRWMFWGWGPRPYGPWKYRKYAAYYDDERRDWEEWHRKEHERMDDSQRRGSSS